jgi:hypothetical protein
MHILSLERVDETRTVRGELDGQDEHEGQANEIRSPTATRSNHTQH